MAVRVCVRHKWHADVRCTRARGNPSAELSVAAGATEVPRQATRRHAASKECAAAGALPALAAALMLARLPRGCGLSARKPCALLPKGSRGLALKNPHRPPQQKRSPQPILGTNKWTVDDRLSRSNKCDPYEQGGKPLPDEEVQMLLARGMVQALSSFGLASRPRPGDLQPASAAVCTLDSWAARRRRPATVGTGAVHQHPE